MATEEKTPQDGLGSTGLGYDANGNLILPVELEHNKFYWGTRKGSGQKEVREPVKVQFHNPYDIEEGFIILQAGEDYAFEEDDFFPLDVNDLIIE